MPTVQADPLLDAVKAMVEAGGSEPGEATIVADHLVLANLSGHDSHGVGMMPHYVRHLGEGKLVPNQPLHIVRDDGPFLVGDGQAGYGQSVALQLMDQAIVKARSAGLAVAGLHNAHHIGRVGTYGERAAAENLVSIHFVNVSGHGGLVAPFRGTDARYCTNPICLSLPATDRHPEIILDFATSKVALGKVRVARNKGEQMAEGLLLGPDGKPTTDPNVMYQDPMGAALPFGEHKGYGLAMFAELLGGALSGGNTIAPHQPRDRGIINNMLVIIIDPERLSGLDYLKGEIDAVIDYFKASPPADPAEPVLVAGEPEKMMREKRRRDGISIDDRTWEELLEAADAVGLTRARFASLARIG